VPHTTVLTAYLGGEVSQRITFTLLHLHFPFFPPPLHEIMRGMDLYCRVVAFYNHMVGVEGDWYSRAVDWIPAENCLFERTCSIFESDR
jgi:hypothetical protein